MAARQQALHVAAKAVERKLNADTSDYTGPTTRCQCGGLARYAGRRPKAFQSVLGWLTLQRAYYYCGKCGGGLCPRDQALGLEKGTLSPGVLRMVGTVGAMTSFEEGGQLLRELAGIEVSAKHVERAAESLGREVAQDEKLVVEPEQRHDKVASTLYLGADGTGIPMRSSEVEGREGKQPDGSSKTREVKLATVWSAEGRDEEGMPVRDQGSVSYSAAIESAATRDTDKTPSEFAQRVEREAHRRSFDSAQRRVVVGDGAAWIWNLAGEYFPRTIQIVDLFHAKEKLSEAAKSIYGAESEYGQNWCQERQQELEAGNIAATLEALRVHAPTDEQARKGVEYLQHNRERMNYARFRAEGLCISSGVLEAGCKTAIGMRCKRAGMHWTVGGANAIIALRCCHLSNRFQGFWQRRSSARSRPP